MTGTSSQCKIFPNGGCYQIKYNSSTWHYARNDCLDGGGDLASFENLDYSVLQKSKKLLSLSFKFYWIGMQKNVWRWEDTGLICCIICSIFLALINYPSPLCFPLDPHSLSLTPFFLIVFSSSTFFPLSPLSLLS